MTNEEISIAENILRNAYKGLHRAMFFRHSALVDYLQHIIDETERLLPEDNELVKSIHLRKGIKK